MKDFTVYIDKALEYFEHQQGMFKGENASKWFHEFFEDPSTATLRERFTETIDCGSRSAIKEMLDFMAELKRAKTIRDKKRSDFFVNTAVRFDGVRQRLERKKIDLSDEIKWPKVQETTSGGSLT